MRGMQLVSFLVGLRTYQHPCTIDTNTDALVIASKDTGLVVNAGKTKFMIRSRDQNAGRSHIIKTENSCFESVEEFKYLGTILTNQNSIREEIKSRLKSGYACYNSVQNPLSSSLLSKNLTININKYNFVCRFACV